MSHSTSGVLERRPIVGHRLVVDHDELVPEVGDVQRVRYSVAGNCQISVNENFSIIGFVLGKSIKERHYVIVNAPYLTHCDVKVWLGPSKHLVKCTLAVASYTIGL